LDYWPLQQQQLIQPSYSRNNERIPTITTRLQVPKTSEKKKNFREHKREHVSHV